MSAKKTTRAKKLPAFDKYFYYTRSVQSAAHDAGLLWKMLRKSWTQALPEQVILQEDFCGTAALCYEWADLGPEFSAVGIDLDDKALAWGKLHHSPDYSDDIEDRVATICGDVLHDHHIRPHVICALNFSYFFIQERAMMLRYFKTCYESLQKGGVFILDTFGGPQYQMPTSDRRRNNEDKFTYWWEVVSFDAISHRMTCHLHYQRDGEAQRKKVFTYKWRMWGVPELTDILREAGFQSVEYWAEGLEKSGYGDGKYKPVKEESDCEAWVIYMVAKK